MSFQASLRDYLHQGSARRFERADALPRLELRVGGFYRQHETVIRDPLRMRVVENRVIELGQPVDSEHPVERTERRKQNHQLEHDWNGERARRPIKAVVVHFTFTRYHEIPLRPLPGFPDSGRKRVPRDSARKAYSSL